MKSFVCPFSRRLVLALFLVIAAAGLPESIRAHQCGPSVITLTVGETGSYRINADVEESEATQYEMAVNSNPAIAEAGPDNFSAKGFGEFFIDALSPGTNTIVFAWSYAPHSASGNCVVQVIVLPKASKPRTSGDQPHSSTANDPVDMYSGEYVLEENPDITIGGPLPLFFQRYYASSLDQGTLIHSGLGVNWMHNFDMRLVRRGTTNNLTVVLEHGKRVPFSLTNGVWRVKDNSETQFQLRESSTNYVFASPETQRFYNFDKAGRLTRIQDRNGNALTLAYANNALASVSDGRGHKLTFTISDFQNITEVSDGTRTVRFGYVYDFGHNAYTIGSVTNVISQVTRYSYDFNKSVPSLMTSRQLPGGITPYTMTYNSAGKVVTQTDAAANTFRFSFLNGLTVVTNPMNRTVSHLHDTNGQVTAITNELGQAVQFTYDDSGRPATIIDRLGRTTSYSYDSASGLTTNIVDVDGLREGFIYRTQSINGFKFYSLAKHIFKDDTFETWLYDARGNVTNHVDAQGRKWVFRYDAKGNLTSITLPTGGTTKFAYTPGGMVGSTLMTGAGRVTNRYDNLNRLVSVTWADKTRKTNSYDPQNLLTNTIDEANYSRTFTQTNGLPKTVRDALGNTTTFSYTGTERLSQILGPNGETTKLYYDSMDRLVAIVDANGNTNRYVYNDAGETIATIDGEGYTWSQILDAGGRVVAVVNPLGQTNSFQLDALGRQTNVTTATGSTVDYAYDALGRLISTRDPLGNVTTNSYNKAGDLLSIKAPNGINGSYTVNALGNVTAVTDGNGKLWSFGRNAAGSLIKTTDPLLKTRSFLYDTRGRVMKETTPLGTMVTSWDPRGLPKRLAYSDKTTNVFNYDERGLLTNGTGFQLAYDANGAITNSNGILIGRDPGGRITSITYASGKTVNYEYDRRNLLVRVTDWLATEILLKRDAAGNITNISRVSGFQTDISYDADGLMVGIRHHSSGADLNTTLTRDAAGRIIAADRNAPLLADPTTGSSSFIPNAASHVAAFKYDALGRLTNDTVRTYQWNLASRLIRVTQSAQTLRFGYDGRGQMISQTNGATVRQFVWNYAFSLPSVAVVRENGADLWYNVVTPDGSLLYTIRAADSARRFYHYDEAGNTMFLSDETETITDSYGITPYGVVTGTNGTTDNPYIFAGQFGIMRIGSGELYYARERFYDAHSQKFLSRDPNFHFEPLILNPYQYAAGNPLSFVDLTGRDPTVVNGAPQSAAEPVVQGLAGAANTAGAVGNVLAEAGQTTIELARIANGWEINNVADCNAAYKILMNDLPKVEQTRATGAKLKNIGKAGTALGVAVAAGEIYQQYNADQQTLQDQKDENSRILETYDNQVRSTLDAFKHKKISEVQRNRFLLQARHQMEIAIMNAQNMAEIDVLLHGLTALKNALGAFTPVPTSVGPLAPENALKK